MVFCQFCEIQSCKHKNLRKGFKLEHQEGDQDTELIFLQAVTNENAAIYISMEESRKELKYTAHVQE